MAHRLFDHLIYHLIYHHKTAIREAGGDSSHVVGVLVGNKADLVDGGRCEVAEEEGRNFASQNGLAFFQTSAVSHSIQLIKIPIFNLLFQMMGSQVEELFSFIAQEYYQRFSETADSASEMR